MTADTNLLPTSAEAARATGSKKYHTGEPCAHGHISPRYACNKRCCICVSESLNRQKAADPEKFIEAKRRAVAKWQSKNKDKIKAYQNANRNIFNESTDRWKKRNPEKVLEAVRKRRAANRQPSRDAALRWQKRNMPKKLALNMKRRMTKRGATPPWLTAEHAAEMEAMYILAQRLTRETGVIHHVDHIEPLRGKTSCGLHVPWNLQVLTESENLKKGAQLDPSLIF